MIDTETIRTDIDIQRCEGAYRNTSFSPERRGRSLYDSYVLTMQNLATFITEKAIGCKRKEDIAQETFDKLRLSYITRFNSVIDARSRCASTMITGAGNFPVAKQEKANNVERKRSDELYEFEGNLQKYALKSLNAVYSTQEKQQTEIEKVKGDIKSAVDSQEYMKKVNVIVRKHKTQDQETIITALIKEGICPDISRTITKPDYMGKIGFASYALTNNNANIKRMKTRLKELESKASEAQECGEKSVQYSGLKVVQNFTEDRLQLIFEGKPDDNVRKVLKSHGFRWSPRFTAWQRKLTNNAMYSLNRLVLPNEAFQQFK